MASVEELLRMIRDNPRDVRFSDLCRICDAKFGPARKSGGSHRVDKTPWPGDPRVNIQNDGGRAKAYQVRQVIKAIDKLEADDAQ